MIVKHSNATKKVENNVIFSNTTYFLGVCFASCSATSALLVGESTKSEATKRIQTLGSYFFSYAIIIIVAKSYSISQYNAKFSSAVKLEHQQPTISLKSCVWFLVWENKSNEEYQINFWKEDSVNSFNMGVLTQPSCSC